MANFDLIKEIQNEDFVAFMIDLVSLDDDKRHDLYRYAYALSLVQQEGELECGQIGIRDAEKHFSAKKMTKATTSAVTTKIKLNNKKFVCDCGCDDFILDRDQDAAFCASCNTSYNF